MPLPSFSERLQHAWNAFNNKDPTVQEFSPTIYYGGSYLNQSRHRLSVGNERSIVNAIFNRIAADVASVDFRHVRLDQNGRFTETVNDGLNTCLTTEANIDQTGRVFIQDAVMSMFDEGVVALVPIETTLNPDKTGSYDITNIRTGKIVQWMPKHVKVSVYNEQTGRRQDIIVPKKMTAIVENPFYSIMNEPNSTLQRLIRKLNILDAVDEQSGAGKLDLIIQLPYTIKTEARRRQAEQRKKDIEVQLADSKYGIAYTDATERITQLNRSVDNHLMDQIKYLTETLMGQLGITNEILNGTADESTMLNYNNRVVAVICTAFAEEMRRTFLTKTARTKGQSISFFQDTFKLVPVSQIAEIADKFTRNEILSSNEIRALIGFKPVDDPRADELRNKNLNQNSDQMMPPMSTDEYYDPEADYGPEEEWQGE